jgi:23S rRNA (guanosine2251-2'-O)-methyltransferase
MDRHRFCQRKKGPEQLLFYKENYRHPSKPVATPEPAYLYGNMVRRKITGKRAGGGSPRPHRKQDPEGRYWLYGRHAVAAALANSRRQVHNVYCLDRATVGATTATVEIVTKESLASLLPMDAVHQGIAADVSSLPQTDLDDLLCDVPEEGMRLAVLDQVSDPRNVGAILRSARAFSIAAVVMSSRHSPPETGALAKPASGALEYVPIVRVGNLARSLETLKQRGFWCYGLDADATVDLPDVEIAAKAAIILGAEGRGMRRLTVEHCDVVAKLPMAPGNDSLNVSAAAAITFFAAFTSN